MKRVAFIAHGPGSANALYPIVQCLKKNKNCEIFLFAFHSFVATLWGVNETPLNEYDVIFQQPFDLIVYGTASGHSLELEIPLHARKLGIKTLSILDIFWASDDNLQMRYLLPPDFLIVPSNDMKKKMESLHIMSPNAIFSFGNPHFDRLEMYKQEKNKKPCPPYSVVFFSQPSNSESFSMTNDICQQAISDLISIFASEPNVFNKLILAPHPRENKDWLMKIEQTYPFVQVKQEKDNFQLVLSSDIIVGINSTLLYESLLIGKPTIFYQNKSVLSEQFMSVQHPTPTVSIPFNATKNCVEFILHFLFN